MAAREAAGRSVVARGSQCAQWVNMLRMVDRVSAASFIGRERELAELEAALLDARSGRPRLVFVAGESGVGKSRLLAEFERGAEAAGVRAIGGECIELGEDELPYAPLVSAVRPLARAADPALDRLTSFARAELARLAPELGEPAPERGEDRDGETQRRLFDSLLALLDELGREQAVLFWLEDLHWADRSTRSFLAFLASSLRDERVLVVCTYRSDELHRRHPLRPLLNELERGPCARRLELAPFDRDEISAQLADILGDVPSDEVVGRLFDRSEGNPLFTEELLAGDLDGRGTLPPTLREALLTRLERLSPGARQTLGLLAVAGRADDSLLAEAGSLEPTQLREALREALGSHLVRTEEHDRFGFRHALFREVLYDDLLPGERSELHLALARALEARADGDGVWIRAAVAHHFHMAGEQKEALRTAVVAGNRAEEMHAFGEAAALFDRALGLWSRVDDAGSMLDGDHSDLLTRAARAYYLAGDDSRSAALLEQAVDVIDAERHPLRAARTFGELANARWSLGQADRSREALQRGLELVPDEPTEEGARLLAHQLRFRLLQGRFAEVETIAAKALEMTEALGLDEIRATVLHRLGYALIPLGDSERGEALMRESIELISRGGFKDDLATAYVNYAEMVHLGGRSEEALALLDKAMPEVVESGRSTRWLGLLRCQINFDIGEWEAAARQIPSADGLARAVTRVNWNVRAAEQALGRGDTESARPLLEDSWEILADAVEPQFIAAVSSLRAELELRERRIEPARRILTEALDRIQYCTEDGSQIAVIAAVTARVEADAAEHARDLGDGDAENEAIARAEVMAELAEAGAEQWGGPVDRATMLGAHAEAMRAVGTGDASAAWQRAADAWAEAGRPYCEAYARWRDGESLLAADERDEAATALDQRARDLHPPRRDLAHRRG